MIAAFFIFSACSTTRTLKESDYLYKKGSIEVMQDDFLHKQDIKSNMKKFISPSPNKKLFGLFPVKLWLYNLPGDRKPEKGIGKWLKTKIGEPPVIFKQQYIEKSERDIKTGMFNRGFFDVKIQTRKNIQDKKVSVKYIISPSKQYNIDTLVYPEKSDSLTKYINLSKEKSVIKPHQPYHFDKLKNERERINLFLKNHGFYAFAPDYLIFKIDTNKNKYTLKMYLEVKNNIPDKAKNKYWLSDIYIHTDYSIREDRIQKDTLPISGYYFIQNIKYVDPQVITRSISLKKGNLYNYSDYTSTLNKLMGLGIYKFVNIEFKEISDTGSNKLDAIIYLTRSVPKSFQAKIQAVTKTNDFTGPGLDLGYSDKNMLNSAEKFSFGINSGFEAQLIKQTTGRYSTETELHASLSIPRFIVPFINANKYLSRKYTPLTKINAEYSYFKRIEYFTMHALDLSFGYNWRETQTKTHRLQLLNLNYSNIFNVSSRFDSILEKDELIKESFDEQFILGLSYNYILNNQMVEKNDVQTYFEMNIEFTGNTLNLINQILTGPGTKEQSPNRLLGIKYPQYTRIFTDMRFYIPLNKHNKIVNRIFFGLGIPYGNSTSLPYQKRFFSGGASSLRGFQYHTIGPGGYEPGHDDYTIDQTGDIKLEGNLEYRFDISKIIKGAVFIDAGNIWLLKENPAKPKGQFQWNTFYKQIAISSGIGIRFDVSFFVLRLDLGFPIRKTYLGENQQRFIHHFRPGNTAWRKENMVVNLAIGYPF